ncbi:hypothetical protein P8935_02145 [Telmatobacter sp. DSM 110680]|uniref:Uncharacterized protein n=1 Tax=Telmatobacter sp. DSM 110680 TaxID=3036704 RepID=A0AAU7DLF6_9BACT
MTLHIHLQIVGFLLVLLGLSHVFMNRYFGWRNELAKVSLLTRQIFYVHTYFIALGVVLGGAVSLAFPNQLLGHAPLNRAILAGMAFFWCCRLLTQFLVYDGAIWRGDRYRTCMHVAFSLLWCYVTAIYSLAFIKVCGA